MAYDDHTPSFGAPICMFVWCAIVLPSLLRFVFFFYRALYKNRVNEDRGYSDGTWSFFKNWIRGKTQSAIDSFVRFVFCCCVGRNLNGSNGDRGHDGSQSTENPILD